MTGYRLLRPLLFSLPPETAHRVVHRLGARAAGTAVESLLGRYVPVRDERLAVEAFGLHFDNPVGVAAGFDKNAHIPGLLGNIGFGHVEVGGVTAVPQEGNPRPRMFRLPEDEALINRMGFNNDGADRVARRLAAAPSPDVPIGINLGKSKRVPDAFAPEDYRYTFERLAPHGQYFVINVSSPNTPGLRELQQREALGEIIVELQKAGAAPLLVKLSPDLSDGAIEDVVELVEGHGLDGIVVTNTTVDRPPSLQSPMRAESGGLSGRPLRERATRAVTFVSRRSDVPIIGVGGVFTGEDAYAKIRAGASLVQLYTGLIYRGPLIARAINKELIKLLERDGYSSIQAAIGADLD